MTAFPLCVRRTAHYGGARELVGHYGESTDARRWLWVTPEDEFDQDSGTVAPDASTEDSLLACPVGWSEERALTVLGYWPAWKALERVRLELGGGIMILGSGRLTQTVSILAGLRGLSWVVAPGCLDGEHLGAALRRLPAPPDAIVLIGDAATHLPLVLPACRSNGAVVLLDPLGRCDVDLYHDAHRRGVRIAAVTSERNGLDDLIVWPRAAVCLGRLLERGLIAPEGVEP